MTEVTSEQLAARWRLLQKQGHQLLGDETPEDAVRRVDALMKRAALRAKRLQELGE